MTVSRMSAIHGQTADFPVVRELPRAATAGPLRVAYALTGAAVVLMVASSLLGLFDHGLYREGAWASEALRGGDLVTLAVAAPLLAFALLRTIRGSLQWPAAWIGLLGYSVYNYGFYVFGPTFNDAFLLHIMAMSVSLFGITFGLPSMHWRDVGERFRNDRWARWIGGVLVAVGVLQGAAWMVLIVRFVVTGELLEQIPVAGQHLIFALDLTLMMPALVIAGVLLYRRTTIGYVLGPAVAVLGAVYSLNGNAAAWFQSHAGVPGTVAVSPTNVVITLAMFGPAVALWVGARRRGNRESGSLAG
jgi:hypothetical protein